MKFFARMCPNNVLLVKIEGPVEYTIIMYLPCLGVVSNPSINQPITGKRTSMVCPIKGHSPAAEHVKSIRTPIHKISPTPDSTFNGPSKPIFSYGPK